MKHRRHRHRRNNHNRPARQESNQQNFQSRNASDSSRDSRQVVQSILPSPEILQEYEYASEGTVARLMEIAETEQDRRNVWEDEYMRFHKKSMRLGQIFGFILLLSVVWGTIYLGSLGKDSIAIALAVSGFFSVALASLFSEIGRRLSRRPRRR